MPSVLPVMPVYGYQAGGRVGEIIESYDDGVVRRHRWSTFVTKELTLRFEKLTKTERDALEAFWIARKSGSLSDHTFYLYNPEEVSAIDLTGVSATGRHSAYFTEPEYSFTREGRCRWSIDLRVKLLD